jgi:hypothetical protein
VNPFQGAVCPLVNTAPAVSGRLVVRLRVSLTLAEPTTETLAEPTTETLAEPTTDPTSWVCKAWQSRPPLRDR